MKNPISESTVAKAQEEAKKTLFYSDYSDTERELLGQLVTVSVIVNNVVDKEATQKAKDAAKAAVTPVKILQGQVLIQEGHVISNQEIRLIELFGLSNGQSNYHELLSYLLFLTGIIIFLAVYFYNPTSSEKKNLSDVATALTVFSLTHSVSVSNTWIYLSIVSFNEELEINDFCNRVTTDFFMVFLFSIDE